MKFAVALLLASSAEALRITQRAAVAQGPPSAEQIAQHIWAKCNTDGGNITWAEASACGAPDSEKPFFDKFAGADGEVNQEELLAGTKAWLAANPPAAGPPSLAQVMQGPTAEQIAEHIWKKCNTDGGNITWEEAKACGAPAEEKPFFDKHAGADGEVNQEELLAGTKAWMAANPKGLAQLKKGGKGPKGPKPDEIMAMCDADASGGITQAEAVACIDANVKDADEAAEMKAGVEDHFAAVDANGDGEVQLDELKAAMKAMKPPKELLAQLKMGDDKGSSAEDILGMCDTNESGGISKAEVIACIKEHDKGANEKEVEADVEKFFPMVDKDKSGEVSLKELEAAMKEHGE